MRGVAEGREVIQRVGGSEEDMAEALLLCASLREGEGLESESSASMPEGRSHALGSLAGGEGARVLKKSSGLGRCVWKLLLGVGF